MPVQNFNSIYRTDFLTITIEQSNLDNNRITLPHIPINTEKLHFACKINFLLGVHFTVVTSEIRFYPILKNWLEVGDIVNISYEYEFKGV